MEGRHGRLGGPFGGVIGLVWCLMLVGDMRLFGLSQQMVCGLVPSSHGMTPSLKYRMAALLDAWEQKKYDYYVKTQQTLTSCMVYVSCSN